MGLLTIPGWLCEREAEARFFLRRKSNLAAREW